jgi:hypothetical protein
VWLMMDYQGITLRWPSHFEDPAGQITMPDAKPRPANQLPPPPAPAEEPIVNWQAPAGITLPVAAKWFDLQLSGPANSRDGVSGNYILRWGKGTDEITVGPRLIGKDARYASDYLPLTSITDNVVRRRVKLPSGLEGFMVDFVFDPIAHPGLPENQLAQRFLLIRRKDDSILLRASGTPRAMAAQAKTIDAIWASVR